MVAVFFFVVAVGIYEDVFERLSDWAISLVSFYKPCAQFIGLSSKSDLQVLLLLPQYTIAFHFINLSFIIPIILLFVTTLCYTTSLVAPKSEISFGGNYNLRFLSAHARRELRAPFFPNPVPASATAAAAPFSLYPGSPVSFYVRGAGFLWTDDKLWNSTSRAFRFPNEEEDEDEDAITVMENANKIPRRVVFSDRLGRIIPWVFQRRVMTEEEMEDDNIHAGLRSGESVFIRDAQSGRFLTVDQGIGSIMDEIYDDKLEDGDVPRIMVR